MDQNPPIITNQSEECCCPSVNPRTMVTERVLSSFILNKLNYARILIGSHLSSISLEDRRIDYVIFVTLILKNIIDTTSHRLVYHFVLFLPHFDVI